MTAKVLIIGLGNIGMGYDLHNDSEEYVLSHARAFHCHPQFQLVGGVDSNPERRRMFEDHYKSPAFQNIEAAMDDQCPDVVVVATPTDIHGKVIGTVLKARHPSAILCEKPISYNIEEARDIVASCGEQKCALFVNYMRRSDIGVAEIRRRLNDGSIGRPVKGAVWYCKGLFNSGSHFLNLLQYLMGDVADIKVSDPGRMYNNLDPEPDFTVTFAGGRIYFLAARAEEFFHNTMELIASGGRLRYEEGGARISWQPVVSNGVYRDYTILDSREEIFPSDFYRVQWHVADQLAKSLAGLPAHICSGSEALKTLETLQQIKESL